MSYLVHHHSQNNARPDLSSAGCSGFKTKAEAIKNARKLAEDLECSQVASREEGEVFRAEYHEAWSPRECEGHTRPRQKIPLRTGPKPWRKMPYAITRVVSVIKA